MYIQVTFNNTPSDKQELLIALLADAGYEGFEQKENSLEAFIPKDQYDEEWLKELADQQSLSFSTQLITTQNWNAVWESNFERVVVDDFVAVRADFHEPVEGVEYEIIITPKMSFGTGHHATTFMMLQQMREIDFMEKRVLDFGTGTGVLAILAKKRGAKQVIAIDNDDWSIENAGENIQRNHQQEIMLVKAESADLGQSFNIILANINRNVILDNMQILEKQLEHGGTLLLSGLLAEDEAVIREAADSRMLVFAGKWLRDKWLCLKFIR
jgi:ribosomal protein L11 methyltransferase